MMLMMVKVVNAEGEHSDHIIASSPSSVSVSVCCNIEQQHLCTNASSLEFGYLTKGKGRKGENRLLIGEAVFPFSLFSLSSLVDVIISLSVEVRSTTASSVLASCCTRHESPPPPLPKMDRTVSLPFSNALIKMVTAPKRMK